MKDSTAVEKLQQFALKLLFLPPINHGINVGIYGKIDSVSEMGFGLVFSVAALNYGLEGYF